jgi:hypothetical protein
VCSNCRITLALLAFKEHGAMFRNRSWNFAHKIQHYHSSVLSTLLYGCATWTTTAASLKRLEATNRVFLRQMFGKAWNRRISYATLLKKSGLGVSIECLIRMRRLNWLKNMADMDTSRLPRQVLMCALSVVPKNNKTRNTLDFKGCLGQDMKLIMESDKDALKIEDIAASPRWAEIVELKGRDFMDRFFVSSAAKSAQRAFREALPFYDSYLEAETNTPT